MQLPVGVPSDSCQSEKRLYQNYYENSEPSNFEAFAYNPYPIPPPQDQAASRGLRHQDNNWNLSISPFLIIIIRWIDTSHHLPQPLLLTAKGALCIDCLLHILHLDHCYRIMLQVSPPARVHASTTIRRDNNQSIPITDVEQRCCTFPAGLPSSSSQQYDGYLVHSSAEASD